MREIVYEYIKNQSKKLEIQLTTMELVFAKKEIAKNQKQKGDKNANSSSN